MATVKFTVRSQRKRAMVDLQIRFSSGANISFYVKSGWSVLSDSWLDKTQTFSSRFTNLGSFNIDEARRIQSAIIELKTVILTAYNNLSTEPSKEWLEEVIHTFHNPVVPIEKAKVTFMMFINQFVKDIESGARLTPDSKRYEIGSVKAYKGFKNRFEEFCKLKCI